MKILTSYEAESTIKNDMRNNKIRQEGEQIHYYITYYNRTEKKNKRHKQSTKQLR